MRIKRNNLVNVIRTNQREHNIKQLAVFEYDDLGSLKVIYFGPLSSFNDTNKIDLSLYRFRQTLLRRGVLIETVNQNVLFVLLESNVSFNKQDKNKNIDNLITLLQEGRNAYRKAQKIENNIFKLLDKMGIFDPEGVPISISNANNLADAVVAQLQQKDDNIALIVDTVSRTVSDIDSESA